MTTKGFFLFSVVYSGFAVAFATVFHVGGLTYAVDAMDLILMLLKSAGRKLHWFLLIGVAAYLFDRENWNVLRFKNIVLALAGALFFGFAFSATKTTLPYVVPFWADAPLAVVDRVLHFGVDPYVLSYKWIAWFPAEWIPTTYLVLWAPLAVFFPVWLIVVDNDAARVRRFLLLYVLTWVVLGNILAGAFMSAGPVYYDRLLGGSLFADLIAALDASGISDTAIGAIQKNLWDIYAGDLMGVGSGISAFPSVHVGVATLLAIYLAERSRYLLPIGLAYLVAIQILSVHIGFHYAIDGYVSIGVVVGFWAVLRRRQSHHPAQSAVPNFGM